MGFAIQPADTDFAASLLMERVEMTGDLVRHLECEAADASTNDLTS